MFLGGGRIMANFNQAIQWMKEGKKVRRRRVQQLKCYIWYIPNIDKGNRMLTTLEKPETLLILDDFEATDWEIYCEEHEWVSYDEVRQAYLAKDHCKNCGIEKPKENSAEFLQRLGTDGQLWAKEFLKITKEKPHLQRDEGYIISWFANAIMTGYDKARAEKKPLPILSLEKEGNVSVEKPEELCKYCNGPIKIRNPTGNCDHLYYPELVNKGKLKTLKDFKDKNCYIYFDKEEKVRCIQERKLKQEAIKDIKALRNLDNNSSDEAWEKVTGIKIKYSQDAIIGIINYIKWKNNLTEEDLR